MKVTSCSEGK
ncbi:hypothetical protein RDI58_010020 [Solanum bulbocastanum]|uniref:Uncharacterized protein n=1 Tax=Solanum bulbocastanum TaxID=147425 RepID=A0AAN8TQ57_SOLBU